MDRVPFWVVALPAGTWMRPAELLKAQWNASTFGLATTSQNTSTISPLPTPRTTGSAFLHTGTSENKYRNCTVKFWKRVFQNKFFDKPRIFAVVCLALTFNVKFDDLTLSAAHSVQSLTGVAPGSRSVNPLKDKASVGQDHAFSCIVM